MHRITKFRPSAAIILACLALFMALGGVGYAATKIHGKTIIDRTVPGKKLKKNAVGGTAIKESALAKVPSAASADAAQQATSAQDAVNAQNAVNAQTAAAVGPDGVGPAALQSNSVSGPKIGSVVIRTDTIGVSGGDSEFRDRRLRVGRAASQRRRLLVRQHGRRRSGPAHRVLVSDFDELDGPRLQQYGRRPYPHGPRALPSQLSTIRLPLPTAPRPHRGPLRVPPAP